MDSAGEQKKDSFPIEAIIINYCMSVYGEIIVQFASSPCNNINSIIVLGVFESKH